MSSNSGTVYASTNGPTATAQTGGAPVSTTTAPQQQQQQSGQASAPAQQPPSQGQPINKPTGIATLVPNPPNSALPTPPEHIDPAEQASLNFAYAERERQLRLEQEKELNELRAEKAQRDEQERTALKRKREEEQARARDEFEDLRNQHKKAYSDQFEHLLADGLADPDKVSMALQTGLAHLDSAQTKEELERISTLLAPTAAISVQASERARQLQDQHKQQELRYQWQAIHTQFARPVQTGSVQSSGGFLPPSHQQQPTTPATPVLASWNASTPTAPSWASSTSSASATTAPEQQQQPLTWNASTPDAGSVKASATGARGYNLLDMNKSRSAATTSTFVPETAAGQSKTPAAPAVDLSAPDAVGQALDEMVHQSNNRVIPGIHDVLRLGYVAHTRELNSANGRTVKETFFKPRLDEPLSERDYCWATAAPEYHEQFVAALRAALSPTGKRPDLREIKESLRLGELEARTDVNIPVHMIKERFVPEPQDGWRHVPVTRSKPRRY